MTVKSLLVKIGADISEFQAQLSKVETSLDKHKAKFKEIGLAMTAVGGTMTAFFTTAVKEAAEQEAAEARLEAALKNVKTATAEGAAMLIRYAESLQATTGYSDEEIIAAQAMLATFQLNEKQIAAITPRLLDMAAATERATGEHQDLQSIAIALGKGLTGMTGALTRYGVVLSEEAKRTGDFNLILESLDNNFKGAAAAAGQTFTGQLRIMKASLGDVVEKLGNVLIPLLVPFIQKMTQAATAVTAWIDAHRGLINTLIPIVAGLGAVLTALGPLVMILPKLIVGIKAVGNAFIFLATNPLGLVATALATAAALFLKVKAAQKEAELAAEREAEVTARLKEKLWQAAQAAGYSAEQFEELTKKYNGNITAMAFAIHRGKEGVAIQEALRNVGKAHAEEIEAQIKALQGFTATQLRSNEAAAAAADQLEKIINLKRQMADETAKATMSEREYQRFALEEAYKERVTYIQKEITDERQRGALLLQAKQTYEAQRAALEKTYRQQDLQFMSEFGKQMAAEWQAMYDKAIEAQAIFIDEKQKITDQINQLTMSELQYNLWALEQERIAEMNRINESLVLTAQQKEELLRLYDEYYSAKMQKAREDATGWTDLVRNTQMAITGILYNFFSDTLDAFAEWGRGGKSILTGLGESFKSMVDDAVRALGRLVSSFLASVFKEIVAAKAAAIAGVIKSVMLALPFPVNLAAVGGAIAAVTALFNKIKLAEGGIVTRPTFALIGESGPEAVIPLDRPGALANAGININQNNYFYGTINNAGDIDEISRRLAERTLQAISKGRRY